MGMLAALGIVKGQPFNPDAATRTILDRAAKTAYKMSRVIGFEENPCRQLLSLTLYEAENAPGYANDQPFPWLGSRDKPDQNADGSTDLCLGASAPPGKQRNWLKTIPGKGYFTILRLYSPTEAAINKSWKPGDLEKMN
jgi:hypothetical protein